MGLSEFQRNFILSYRTLSFSTICRCSLVIRTTNLSTPKRPLSRSSGDKQGTGESKITRSSLFQSSPVPPFSQFFSNFSLILVYEEASTTKHFCFVQQKLPRLLGNPNRFLFLYHSILYRSYGFWHSLCSANSERRHITTGGVMAKTHCHFFSQAKSIFHYFIA